MGHAGAGDGEGLHVHHVGVDGVIGGPGDHRPARGQAHGRQVRQQNLQGQFPGQVEIGGQSRRDPQGRGVYVPVTDAGHLVDLRLLQRARAGGSQADGQVRGLAPDLQPGQGGADGQPRLDRTYPGHQGGEAGAQGRPVLRRGGHDEEDAAVSRPDEFHAPILPRIASGVSAFGQARRHRSEQYFTSSQTFSHFFRQAKGRPQTGQVLVGRSALRRAFTGQVPQGRRRRRRAVPGGGPHPCAPGCAPTGPCAGCGQTGPRTGR